MWDPNEVYACPADLHAELFTSQIFVDDLEEEDVDSDLEDHENDINTDITEAGGKLVVGGTRLWPTNTGNGAQWANHQCLTNALQHNCKCGNHCLAVLDTTVLYQHRFRLPNLQNCGREAVAADWRPTGRSNEDRRRVGTF